MRNLKAEMARTGVSKEDIMNLLGCSLRTVDNKLDEITDFTIPEAFKIRDTFFRNMRMEYLFCSQKTA